MIEPLTLDFRKNNNPRQLHEGHFTAYLGNYPKFSTYVAFYRDSVEILFRQVSEGRETADSVALPLLYLMRHTMELGYKYSLVHLCALNSTKFEPEKVEKHSLVKLHERLHLEYYTALKNGSFPESDRESFEKHYANTDSAMKRFVELDSSSTRTRFPNIDESPHFPLGMKIDILELKNQFDDAMILLSTMADVIDQYDWSNFPEFRP